MGVLALLWGSGFLWIKLALTGLTPVQITVIRCALGAAVLLVLARASHQKLPRRTWGRLAIAAFFCNALPFLLFGIGEQTVDSGVAGVLNATTPLFSLLIGLVIGTERGLTPVRVTGLVLGFAGVLLIFAPWRHDVVGVGALALLAAAASYAVAFAYMGRKLVGKGGPVAVSAAQLTAATGLGALMLPFDPTPATLNVTAIVAVALLGVFGTGITFYLNYRIIEDEGPTSAATVGYLLPVVSVALGAIVLDEPLTPRIVAGMAVVLAGVALTRLALTRSALTKRPPERKRRYQLSVMSTERDDPRGRSADLR
ncbi:EamA family transporter [Saccharothrix sp. ALI-22-I]|uniref:DMT family transporter n=1 Tax=Saccharothrix sp. ALI-22-I TaxID=1933778 RepID=UPI00097CA51C|nr:DMT family transporter [Saccharothrix sp. ALI-22-I]ONI86872.1 EamA family transporter [Saccharothrix sp. ALI-22-I]